MRRRRNEFGRADRRWGNRDIFGERRRRRVHWVPILVVLVLAAGAYALSDPQRRDGIHGLWAEISKPAPTVGPESGDRLSILPLPPEPSGAH